MNQDFNYRAIFTGRECNRDTTMFQPLISGAENSDERHILQALTFKYLALVGKEVLAAFYRSVLLKNLYSDYGFLSDTCRNTYV